MNECKFRASAHRQARVLGSSKAPVRLSSGSHQALLIKALLRLKAQLLHEFARKCQAPAGTLMPFPSMPLSSVAQVGH